MGASQRHLISLQGASELDVYSRWRNEESPLAKIIKPHPYTSKPKLRGNFHVFNYKVLQYASSSS